MQRRLLRWYDASARDLPWRGEGRTPYRLLVSEAMLQQTQVATVIPYFHRFIAAFPRVQDLAGADEQAVLRLWQGLGYYSRARNLHRAAKEIVQRHGGEVPASVADLLALPGVGKYTAGAVASIAFDIPAPIVDGNVTRVLCRLDQIEADPRRGDIQKRLWERAGRLVPARRAGDFNSALMELGATVCTPRSPRCNICPVRRWCSAAKAGVQETIPLPSRREPTPILERDVYRIRDARGRLLVEQRPATGRWAGLWQFITRPAGGKPPVPVEGSAVLGTIRHALTHRRYVFRVFDCRSEAEAPAPARWAAPAELDALPMPRPHVRVRGMPAGSDAPA